MGCLTLTVTIQKNFQWIIASRMTRLLVPKRITETHLFLQGVHPAVIAGFPEWPWPIK